MLGIVENKVKAFRQMVLVKALQGGKLLLDFILLGSPMQCYVMIGICQIV